MHADAIGDPVRPAAHRTGNCSVALAGQGEHGLASLEYTLGELFSDAGYAHRDVWQVARR